MVNERKKKCRKPESQEEVQKKTHTYGNLRATSESLADTHYVSTYTFCTVLKFAAEGFFRAMCCVVQAWLWLAVIHTS